MAEMSREQFIDQVILNELREIIVNQNSHYVGFILMAIAIEYLGMLLDSEPMSKQGRTEERFNKGLKLFREAYKPYTKSDNKYYFYRHLRGGLVHQLRPLGLLNLTHRKEADKLSVQHLKKYGDKLVLVAEDMYEDLEKAVNRLKTKEKKGECEKKLNKPFLSVPDREPSSDNNMSRTNSPGLSGSGDVDGNASNRPLIVGTNTDFKP